jgi:hypothetical protein
MSVSCSCVVARLGAGAVGGVAGVVMPGPVAV